MSSGKIKCTCGWSWNKSDSSKKDMYICHECGRDNSNNMKNGGWLDNYNKEDNYNDYNVSAPEGFQGDGYSNVGRTTSPAWGGQFQMGGVLPGAVGHMYARHGAPSEGKYAKKTLPSAQNGQEMQYYREGLDFQPKTISRDGGIIKDDRGQWGEHKGEPTRINQSEPGSYIDMGPDPLTDEPLTQPLLGISDKGERKIMYPGEKHKYKKGTKYVDEYPMAKNGVNQQDQKTLQHIDQLTNFTNYNTKQSGGWLDQY